MFFRILSLALVSLFCVSCDSDGASGSFTTTSSSNSSSAAGDEFLLKRGVYSTKVWRQGDFGQVYSLEEDLSGTTYSLEQEGTRLVRGFMSIFPNNDNTYNIIGCYPLVQNLSRSDVLAPFGEAAFSNCSQTDTHWENEEQVGAVRSCDDDSAYASELEFIADEFTPPLFSVSILLDNLEIWSPGDSYCATASTFSGSQNYLIDGQLSETQSIKTTRFTFRDNSLDPMVNLELEIFGSLIGDNTASSQYILADYDGIGTSTPTDIRDFRYQAGRFVATVTYGSQKLLFDNAQLSISSNDNLVELLISGTTTTNEQLDATIYMYAPQAIVVK